MFSSSGWNSGYVSTCQIMWCHTMRLSFAFRLASGITPLARQEETAKLEVSKGWVSPLSRDLIDATTSAVSSLGRNTRCHHNNYRTTTLTTQQTEEVSTLTVGILWTILCSSAAPSGPLLVRSGFTPDLCLEEMAARDAGQLLASLRG